MTSKMTSKSVSTVDELVAAVHAAVSEIVVQGQIEGEDDQAALSFAAGQDCLQLTSDNVVRNLHVETSADRRAIFNDASVDSLGTIHLYDVVTFGQVQFMAHGLKDSAIKARRCNKWLAK